MSKRFGRNQKRKLKAEIDSLKSELKQKDSYHAGLRETVSRTADILGRYFISLPESQIDVHERCLLDRGINIPQYRMPNTFIGDDCSRIDDEFTNICLDIIQANPTHRSNIDGAMHLSVSYKGERVAYALSEQAVKIVPEYILIEDISNRLASLLVKEMKQCTN